jgi:Ca2+-binding EF-hand superfamily protein
MRRSRMRAMSCYLGAVCVLGLSLLPCGAAMAQTGPSANLKDWFQRHDKNGDSKIDRGEFQEAVVEGFYFRDKDKNGYLTIEELQTASPEVVKAASRKGDARLSVDEYANALFKDYAAADTDGDGELTIEEIDVYIRTNRR